MNVKPLAAVLVVGIAAWPAWKYTHKMPRPVFQTAAVEQGDLQSTVTATGSINARLTVGVGTQITGVVTALYADFESKVHKGELLADVDPRQYEDALKTAQANVNSAKAGLTAAEAAARAADESIDAARASVDSYKKLAGVFTVAKQQAQRQMDHEVALGGIVTADDRATAKETFELADDDSAKAASQEEVSELTVQEKIAEADAAKAQVTAARAQLTQAEELLQQAQISLSYTHIKSPIDGTVLNREVNVGQTVVASAQTPELFQIAKDLNKVQVDVNLDESDVSRVKVGDEANFTVDAFPGRTFGATVERIRMDAVNVNNVISYDVVLDVPPAPVALLPGMTANIHILSAQRSNVTKVPNAALRFRPLDKTGPLGNAATPGSTASVYVLDAAGAPVTRRIVIGISDSRQTEVVSGDLRPGDGVVVDETLSLK